MIRFEIRATPLNLQIAGYLERAHDVKTKIGQRIVVSSEGNPYGLKLSKLEMGSAILDLTDNDWRLLGKEVRRTVRGGKVREFTNWIIDIEPLRTQRVYVRLTPFEEEEIREAAKVEKKTISDFIRGKVLQGVAETSNRETILRQVLARKREQRERERTEKSRKAPQRYVT
jgi:uncharacterized protein (DUF1778 family)